MDRLDLPFAHFSTTKDGSNATSFAWDLDVKLDEGRPLKFFSLLLFREGPVDNQSIIKELSARIIDSVRYQQAILEGNRVSITPEDFFEQCLQKVNSEIALFLKEISAPLPVHSWSMVIGMLGHDEATKRLQFFTSRFGKVTGWLLNNAQLETKKLISIFDVPDLLPVHQIPQKFFRNVLASTLPQNDQLFFCTPNLLNYISLSEIKHVLSTLSVAAAVKHFENQINFSSSDSLVSGITLKLSPYTISTEQPLFQHQPQNVQDSIDTLMNTQSQTQRLLGNQGGSPLASAGAAMNQLRDAIVTKLSPKESSKLIPTASKQKNESTPVKMIHSTVRATQRALKTTSKMLQNRSENKIQKKSSLDMVSTNQGLTKVGVWQEKLKAIVTPIKGLGSWIKSTNILKQPIFWAVCGIAIVGISGMMLFKKSVAVQQENKTEYVAALDKVQGLIDTIDSHLIVGREADATGLLQESQALIAQLEATEDEDLSARKSTLIEEVEERHRKLRKETLIATPEVLIENIASVLTLPGKRIIEQGDNLALVSESPQHIALANKEDLSWEKQSVTSDLSEFTSVTATDANQLVFVYNNTTSTLNLNTGEAISTVSNTQSPLIGSKIFNNRLYTLSPQDNQIFKSGQNNFSVLGNWLNEPGEGVSDAVDLAIDGSIYVLKPDHIVQFLSGRPARPGIQLDPITPALTDARIMWVSVEGNNLFVAESNRILHYKKTGKFVSQYILDGASNYVDLYFDEDGSQVYALTPEKLYRFGV
jgi:hypothetical protein